MAPVTASDQYIDERLHSFLNNSPAIGWLTDDAERFVFVSDHLLARLALPRDAVIGKTAEEIWQRYAAAKCGEANLFSRSDKSQTVERLTHPNGGVSWWLTNRFSFQDASGKRLFGGLAVDITERQARQATLEASESWLRSILDNTNTCIASTDSRGYVTGFNEAFRAMLGYDAETLRRMNFAEITHPDDLALESEIFNDILAGKRDRYQMTKRYVAADGRIVWVDLSTGVIRNAQGEASTFVAVVHDVTERKAAAEEINQLAYYDPLTQLPNRRLFLDLVQKALGFSARSAHRGAMLLIDLDDFKTLNDTLGHDTGDLLLQQVARRLTTCTREGDTVARIGGDEFVVMLEGLDADREDAARQAKATAEQILAALDRPYLLGSHKTHSTPSIGIALFRGHEVPVEELLKRTDLAMYQAKTAGRNTLCFFDPEMQAIVTQRASLEADLREAVAQRQFVLHYQPQVVDDGRVTGAEALVRWQHPQRGMVSPAEFIPLAEETGLILPLGHWVLETACRQLARWASQPQMAQLTVAVNISANQLHQPDFVDHVLAVLASTGANPRRLKLELTESLLVSEVENCIAKMTALKEAGVGFSLDDFGTGYSSLAYLKRLPLDQLKVDQSFVRGILLAPNDAAIVNMIVALAESMGLSVIAEGVETEAQKDFLASHGCHAYQGYLFSRPVPLADFEKLVTQAW